MIVGLIYEVGKKINFINFVHIKECFVDWMVHICLVYCLLKYRSIRGYIFLIVCICGPDWHIFFVSYFWSTF